MKKQFTHLFTHKGLTILILIVVMLVGLFGLFFSDDHNLILKWKYDKEIERLEDEIEIYRNQTRQNEEKLQQLHSDKECLERFARERYKMHAPNEDVFVVE